jgi:hypothetical protein
MEDGYTPQLNKLNRRDFLKLAVLTATGALLHGSDIYRLAAFLRSKPERDRKQEIKEKIERGDFLVKDKPSKSIEEVSTSILRLVENSPGISESRTCFFDGQSRCQCDYQAGATFIPASVITLLLCNEAEMMGQKDSQTYLTPQLATAVLAEHKFLDKLVMALPLAQGRSSKDMEKIVREIMLSAGVPAQNPEGLLPIEVDINTLFQYLINLNMPPLMKQNLLQSKPDVNSNYGSSAVTLPNLEGSYPSYFQIGVLYDQGQLLNSYFYQFGDQFKALGYSKGDNPLSLYTHMLQVGAYFASYARQTSQPSS